MIIQPSDQQSERLVGVQCVSTEKTNFSIRKKCDKYPKQTEEKRVNHNTFARTLSYENKLVDLKEFLEDQSELLETIDKQRASISSKSSSEVPLSERDSCSSSCVDNGSSDMDNVFLVPDRKIKQNDSQRKLRPSDINVNHLNNSEEETPFQSPSPDTLNRIASMVEYYLSDENLSKDMFLLKHIIKHQEGYVSLKLLSNYKKVKRISKDWMEVRLALKDSTELDINPEGTKIRRRKSLPFQLEVSTRPFRSILAYDIPSQKASMDKLAAIFGSFGEINSLQIYKPGGRMSHGIQGIAHQRPSILDTICAIIEYENVHYAHQALTSLCNNKQISMKVTELQNCCKRRKSLDKVFNLENESSYYSASELDEPFHYASFHYASTGYESSSAISSTCESPFSFGSPYKSTVGKEPYRGISACSWRRASCTPSQMPHNNRISPFEKSELPSSPNCKPKAPLTAPLPRRKFNKDPCNSIPKPSGQWFPKEWFEKDKKIAGGPTSFRQPTSKAKVNRGSYSSSPSASPLINRRKDFGRKKSIQENVIRLPIGPDGSQGFRLGKMGFASKT